jgi:hypothetical protein
MMRAMGFGGVLLFVLFNGVIQALTNKRIGLSIKPRVLLADKFHHLVKIQILHIS